LFLFGGSGAEEDWRKPKTLPKLAEICSEKLHIWVKWTPNLALFAAAFCSLRIYSTSA
jgi:hypothetical protein